MNTLNLEEVTHNTLTLEDYLNSKNIEKVTDNELLNHALHYAKIGYPVLPLHSLVKRRGKVHCSCREGLECDKTAKHPRTRFGHKDATTNEQTIRAWWEKYPNANIAILTGVETGIFVLDIDLKYGGEYSLDYLREDYKTLLKEKYAFLPGTLTTFTGSGGRHLYFKHPLNVKITGSASVIGEGLDIRGEDNYIIVPPSRHISGNQYFWFGTNTPIEEAPIWLLYEIVNSKQQQEKQSAESVFQQSRTKYSEKVAEGKRNEKLVPYICGLVNSFSKDEVLRRALDMNNRLFEPSLPEKRIESTVNWAWKKYGSSK